MGASKLLGNPTGSSASPGEINLSYGLTFAGNDMKVNSPTCASNERLSWNGSTFECKGGGVFSEIVAANQFLLGPTSGGATNPSFRSIAAEDIGSGTATNQDVLLGDLSWFQLLDSSGKIDSSVLPSSITGSLNFKGTWDATTNTPTLTSGGGGVNGEFYIVEVAGTTSLDGTAVWNIGDWVINNGTIWERVEQGSSVASVNSKQGAVVLTTDDITEGVTNKYFTDLLARNAFS